MTLQSKEATYFHQAGHGFFRPSTLCPRLALWLNRDSVIATISGLDNSGLHSQAVVRAGPDMQDCGWLQGSCVAFMDAERHIPCPGYIGAGGDKHPTPPSSHPSHGSHAPASHTPHTSHAPLHLPHQATRNGLKRPCAKASTSRRARCTKRWPSMSRRPKSTWQRSTGVVQ